MTCNGLRLWHRWKDYGEPDWQYEGMKFGGEFFAGSLRAYQVQTRRCEVCGRREVIRVPGSDIALTTKQARKVLEDIDG